MQDAVLAAFFVIHHDLQCQPRPAGPLRIGRIAAIADHVAWVGFGHSGARHPFSDTFAGTAAVSCFTLRSRKAMYIEALKIIMPPIQV